MVVRSVSLRQVRNYEEEKVELGKGVNIFYGENAQGKTNFLESIYFCATGRSPRTHSDREMIQFGKTDAHMQVFVEKRGSIDRIDAQIRKDSNGSVIKGIAVNGIAVKKLSELFGVLLTVIFSPEDMMIVKAGPAERRRFVDMELCQLSGVYYYELQQYYQALRQRNSLLKRAKSERDTRQTVKQTVFVWDEQLFEHGRRIIRYRGEFVERLSEISGRVHGEMTEGRERLELEYKPNVGEGQYMDRLQRSLERDILTGTTSVGIHKDEVLFLIDGHDARVYGSQGQQRTASISAKLAEITLIREEKGETPVLLLDDVFSELDERRRKQLVERITDMQAVITCAGEDGAVGYFKKNGILKEVKEEVMEEVIEGSVCCFEVKSGNIFRVE